MADKEPMFAEISTIKSNFDLENGISFENQFEIEKLA